MKITIKDVLNLEGFKKAKVIAGHMGLTNTVDKATLMEVPDISLFVKEHSLLITTLYPIYNNKEVMENIIPQISKLNVAGICIKTDRYINEIPKFMIEQANELAFPIIELSNNDNLSDLVSEIISLSLDKHIEVLKFQNSIHNHLMNLFLKGGDMDSLINGFSELVKHPIILLDNNMNLIFASKDINNKKVIIDFKDKSLATKEFDVSVDEEIYTMDNYIKHSIEAGKNKFGYLIILEGDNHQQSMIMALEEASLLIASAFYKNYAVSEKEKNFQDSFIRDILQGVNYSQMEAIIKARAYGWELEFPQVILVMKIFNNSETFKKNAYETVLNSRIIETIMNKKLIMKEKNTKITYIDESLVIFANVAFINDSKLHIIELANIIKSKLKDKYHLGIGISNTIVSLNSFPNAYKEAQDSLAIGEVFNKDSFVSHYDDYQLFSIIKDVNSTSLLYKYVQKKLGKIMAYDKENNMELMKTLLVLTETGFNSKEASRKLFIHYNTLRYRLDRLRELGVDISNGFAVSEIVLAYNINIWLDINSNKISDV